MVTYTLQVPGETLLGKTEEPEQTASQPGLHKMVLSPIRGNRVPERSYLLTVPAALSLSEVLKADST